MGLLLLFRGVAGAAPYLKAGYGQLGLFGSGKKSKQGYGKVGIVARGVRTGGTIPSAPTVVANRYPTISYQVAFSSQPLTINPAWIDLSSRLRALGSKRGRSYEFDRTETGTMEGTLDNRDAALSPSNTSSAYTPIKSTRPVKAVLQWVTAYPLFRGISEGFPQTYQSFGKDSLVSLQASDLFYGLNNSRFTPGSTILLSTMVEAPTSTQETIVVASTAAPMPASVPFDITIGDEKMSVLQIVDGSQYLVSRTASEPLPHTIGEAVTTTAVSFGEALSGERIRQVLEAVGFNSSWYDLDAGHSLIAPSEDLATTSPLEHINLIADAEFGRFFASRDGKFTFKDRHALIFDYLSAVFTFRAGANTAASEVPFTLDGELSHSEEKLFNRVRIMIQGGLYDGQVVDISDDISIANHFERVFERTFPYASINDATSAAQFVLLRNSEAALRLPGISVKGAIDPTNLWPLLLAREIGDRVRFRYQPEGGGTEIDKHLAIDGIAHNIQPGDHTMTFQCTEIDSTQYWILGTAGYSELDTTTRVAF